MRKNEVRNEVVNDFSAVLFAAFRSFRTGVNKLFEEHIPWNEFVVLRIVHREKREMVSRIAQELHVSNSHITSTAERLVKKGYMTRTRCETDRRVVYLAVTVAGAQLVDEMERVKQAYLEERFAALTEAEMRGMTEMLKKLL